VFKVTSALAACLLIAGAASAQTAGSMAGSKPAEAISNGAASSGPRTSDVMTRAKTHAKAVGSRGPKRMLKASNPAKMRMASGGSTSKGSASMDVRASGAMSAHAMASGDVSTGAMSSDTMSTGAMSSPH